MVPGPTLRLKRGDELHISFHNKLVDQNLPYVHNQVSAPDESNVHFHGLHVHGELPSDDVTYVVKPGDSYNYMTTLPQDHMPGTHWIHPHRHGSTTLQVGGGAASVLIVEDLPGTLSFQVDEAREIIFMAHQMNFNELEEVAFESNDRVFQVETSRNRPFVAVNGQINPIISVKPGEWIRFRILWVAWIQGLLNFEIDGYCWLKMEFIYPIFHAPLPRHPLFQLEELILW